MTSVPLLLSGKNNQLGAIAIPVTSLGAATTGIGDSAGVTFNSDGSLSASGNTSVTTGSSWNTPNATGVGAYYWIRVTLNSGTAPTTGTTGSWLALSSQRTFSWLRNASGTTTANITIEIASDSGGTVIAATKTLGISVAITNGINASAFWWIGSGSTSAPASAQLQIGRDFNIFGSYPGSLNNSSLWGPDLNGTIGDSYWAKVTIDSGPNPTGDSVGSWIQCNSARAWTFTKAVAGSQAWQVDVQVASDSGGSSIVWEQLNNSFTVTAT